MTVAELLEAVRQEGKAIVGYDGERGRYVAIERIQVNRYERVLDEDGYETFRVAADHERTVTTFRLFGGGHIYTYKTLRNARKAAGDGGFVCVLDISKLPIVDGGAVADGVDDKNEIDEFSLAERQLLIWEQRVRELKARQSK